jgi:hypothetical protein
MKKKKSAMTISKKITGDYNSSSLENNKTNKEIDDNERT